jgi:catechol 2,3-dioxygenase-like lactoylglutathione lyase family enzyme
VHSCHFLPAKLAIPTMTQFISAISLIVPDYDQAIDFYVGLMGFELFEDTPLSDEERLVLVAPSGSTETRIRLSLASNEAQEEVIGEQAGNGVFMFLETYDFDGDIALMERAGVDIIEEPRFEDHGKLAIFRDPFGNKWELLERH